MSAVEKLVELLQDPEKGPEVLSFIENLDSRVTEVERISTNIGDNVTERLSEQDQKLQQTGMYFRP